MNKLFTLFLFLFTILFATDNSFTTIQLFSSKKLTTALKVFKKIPLKLQKQCFVLKIHNYYTIRCYNKNFIFFKKIFKDAYINKTYKWRLNNIIYPKNNLNLPLEIYKANKYFQNKDYLNALKTYIKIYNYNKNKQVLINIAYIFGILNQQKEFIKFIKNKKQKEYLIYSFCIGNLKYSQILKKFIINNLKYSKKGYLNLLLGYIYEKEKNIPLAIKQYKIAYSKNPYNKNFIYLYARSLELKKDYKNAIILYKKISNCDDIICKYAKDRINEIQ